MITIDLGSIEFFDGKENKFAYKDGGKVNFEYSLKAIYDWEGIHQKLFLKGNLTYDETVDFYTKMALTEKPLDADFMTDDVMELLAEYIKASHTATTFTQTQEGQNGNNHTRGKIYSSEELYALMFANNIPLEFEKRNLNRLLVVLRIIALHNNPPKKLSKQDILKQNRQLNAERKKMLNSRG